MWKTDLYTLKVYSKRMKLQKNVKYYGISTLIWKQYINVQSKKKWPVLKNKYRLETTKINIFWSTTGNTSENMKKQEITHIIKISGLLCNSDMNSLKWLQQYKSVKRTTEITKESIGI